MQLSIKHLLIAISILILIVVSFGFITVFAVEEMLRIRQPAAINTQPAGTTAREESTYDQVVKAMARLSLLEYEFKLFQQNAAKYDEVSKSILSAYRANRPVEIQTIMVYQNELTYLAKTLGHPIDLDSHPVYDQHPERPVPGEETILNAADKSEYRKYFNQFATAALVIEDMGHWFQDEMRKENWIIRAFATKP
jgi:hypothetical protein